jgi:dihydrofolate synthase/folylpolyglutamate synthase
VAHVAGTKGKGSTSASLAAVARAAGWTTGLYVTPHLHSFRERIQLGDTPISEAEFAVVAALVAEADVALRRSAPQLGEPTAFEAATALALLAFARAGVDVAVVEVGMGGRLDATNVVEPAVSAISTISYDHMAILGDTLDAIAMEKGGIIKPGRPVAIGPQRPEALATLERIAAERGAPLYVAGRDWQTVYAAGRTQLRGPWGDWRDVQLALRGAHQAENAGLALYAAWLLEPSLLADETAVRAALASMRWPGRFELLAERPAVYADGAHNVDSVERLAATLRELDAPQLALALGIGRDKDVEGMLRALAPLGAAVFATASHNPRAAEARRIAAAARAVGLRVELAPSVAAALDAARHAVGPAGVVCVTGSLYAVAEVREALGLAQTPTFERELLYG